MNITEKRLDSAATENRETQCKEHSCICFCFRDPTHTHKRKLVIDAERFKIHFEGNFFFIVYAVDVVKF